jgi:hypothetical protein
VRIDFELAQPTKVWVTVPGADGVEMQREQEIPALAKGPYLGSGKQVIMNYSDQSGWVVSPTDKIYSPFLDEPDVVDRLVLTMLLFSLRPAAQLNSETHPCGKNAEFPCKRVGAEKLNGREAVKWETSKVQREMYTASIVPLYLWVDRDLGILLKSSEPGSAQELTNLRQITQDASLFQPPAGFNKK